MKRETAAYKNSVHFAKCIRRITDICRSAEMRKITVNTIYRK
jgi:hypothetical protein